MNPRRVVVTGLGAITSIGRNRVEFWENLIAGRPGSALLISLTPAAFGFR